MSTPSCPRCHTEVGATWRWCLACGYDPDGAQLRIRDEHLERHLRKGSWLPVVVVLAGMIIGAAILWRTAPDDLTAERTTPTVSEPVVWQLFLPEGGAFRAEYPAPPFAEDTVSAADGRVEQSYLAMVNQQFFAVVVSDTGDAGLDAGVSDAAAEATLQGFVARSARTRGAQVGPTKLTHVSTAPALDYELESGATQTRGRAVLLGRQVFDVVVSGPQLVPADVDHFVDSFALR
jgi:hypothetical protein